MLFSADARGHKRNRSDETALVTLHEPPTEAEIVTVETPVVHVVPSSDFATHKIIPVTPLVVGQVMSKDDRYYTPHKNNPFVEKFEDANTKLIGSMHENWIAWFDLHSPSVPMTPPVVTEDYMRASKQKGLRRCYSLPGSPTLSRKREADKLVYHEAGSVAFYPRARRTLSSQLPLIKRLDSCSITDSCPDDSFDAQSEGSSSNDSALGTELISKELRGSGSHLDAARHLLMSRQISSERSMLNISLDRYRSRVEFLARAADGIHHADSLSPRSRFPMDRVHHLGEEFAGMSYSSSESCMSLDEASIMSPTSSYSSYGDSEDWQYSRAQLEHYEQGLRSRERFQELIRRWEAKQSNQTHQRRLAESNLCEHQQSDSHVERKFQELRKKWESESPTGKPPPAPPSLPKTRGCAQPRAFQPTGLPPTGPPRKFSSSASTKKGSGSKN